MPSCYWWWKAQCTLSHHPDMYFVVVIVWLLSHVWLFVTPWTAVHRGEKSRLCNNVLVRINTCSFPLFVIFLNTKLVFKNLKSNCSNCLNSRPTKDYWEVFFSPAVFRVAGTSGNKNQRAFLVSLVIAFKFFTDSISFYRPHLRWAALTTLLSIHQGILTFSDCVSESSIKRWDPGHGANWSSGPGRPFGTALGSWAGPYSYTLCTQSKIQPVHHSFHQESGVLKHLLPSQLLLHTLCDLGL